MPLVAITGLPGSGKSAVLATLRALGRTAVGTDEDRLSGWRDRTSRQPVPDPPDWHDPVATADIEYRVGRERIAALRARAADDVIYVCGFAGDEADCWDLLDVIVCLVVDSETLRRRLATRTANTYGKAEHELRQILAANTTWEQEYRRVGARIVDASQDLDKVVADVIAIAEPPS